MPTARAISDFLSEQSGRLVGHLVVDDEFVALRTHGDRRGEVATASSIAWRTSPMTAPMSRP
jgi:hypothetical protein